MLVAAVFGTLAEEEAGLAGLQRDPVRAAGDQVDLAGEARDPVAVADVGRFQRQVDRARRAVLAHRHVKLVGGGEIQLAAVVRFVVIFPPPLAADDGDKEGAVAGVRAGRRAADFPKRARGDQDEEEDDHRGGRGPGDFDRLAAVDLRRFRGAGRRAVAGIANMV